MSSLQVKLKKLGGESPLGFLRLVFRKLVYRKVSLRRYEVTASDSQAPRSPLALRVSFLKSPDFDLVLGTSPHLAGTDVERFRQQN